MILYANLTHDPPEKIQARNVVTLVEKLKLEKDGHSKPCVTRIRWSLDNAAISTPGFVMKGERINEIEEASDGTTIYRTWQVFGGVGARFTRKRLEGPWKGRMQDWSRDLKAWCERVHANGSAGHASDSVGGAGRSEGGQTQEVDDSKGET